MEVIFFERSVPTEDLGERTDNGQDRNKLKMRVSYVMGKAG